MILEFVKFIFYSSLIVLISKYGLVTILRRLAETLDLKAKTVGEIAGTATSIPELLTVSISSFNGFLGTSVTNILSSNIINLLQYIVAIFWNKNQKMLKEKTIVINLVLVLITIFIPILLIILNIELNLKMIIIFIILYFLFRFLNNLNHNTNFEKEKIENEFYNDKVKNVNKKSKILKYLLGLILIGILLFFIGNLLGDNLEILCNLFSVPQWIIGILLGAITSIPEFITFFESQKHYKNNEKDELLGVIEATNNLLTSNSLNLFIIQSVGILIYLFL